MRELKLARRTRGCPGILLDCPYHHLMEHLLPSSLPAPSSPSHRPYLDRRGGVSVTHCCIVARHDCIAFEITRQAYRVAFRSRVQVHTEIFQNVVVSSKRSAQAQLAFEPLHPCIDDVALRWHDGIVLAFVAGVDGPARDKTADGLPAAFPKSNT